MLLALAGGYRAAGGLERPVFVQANSYGFSSLKACNELLASPSSELTHA